MSTQQESKRRQSRPRAKRGVTRADNALIEVKFRVDALRTVRTTLMQVAYALGENPGKRGYLVLVDSPITEERLRAEWDQAATVLRGDVLDRLTICLHTPEQIVGIPRDPDAKTQRLLSEAADPERGGARAIRPDFSFLIQKLLFHRWLTDPEPVTSDWLARAAGCSYPVVARVLQSLGSLIERGTDRRVALRWFSEEAFARLAATADRARSTTRFADQSGQPRSAESHLRRLDKLTPPGLAIGGVLGAKHYDPDLDLVGTPRLDLSVHCPGERLDLSFIKTLDPALARVEDPLEPATVVVHAVRHADSLFAPRDGGLAWADPLECLFDLHEAGFRAQASQFLETLQRRRPAV